MLMHAELSPSKLFSNFSLCSGHATCNHRGYPPDSPGGGGSARMGNHILLYTKKPLPSFVHSLQNPYLYQATGLTDCPGGSFIHLSPWGNLHKVPFKPHYTVVSKSMMEFFYICITITNDL